MTRVKLVPTSREYVKKASCKRSSDQNRNFAIESGFLFEALKDVKISNEVFKKFLWLMGTGRNALVVIVCALVSYIYETRGGAPFILTGHIDAGLPAIKLTSFSRTVGNHTETFFDMCGTFGTGILIVPLISIIGNVAIAKAFCKFRLISNVFSKEIVGFPITQNTWFI